MNWIKIIFCRMHLNFRVYFHRIALAIWWICFKKSLFIIKHKLVIMLSTLACLVFLLNYAYRSFEASSPPNTAEASKESEYEFVEADCSWQEAYDACIANGGHLVTMETDKEYQRVIALLEAKSSRKIIFYIGALRKDNDKEYHWITDDTHVLKGKNNWLEGEPSFQDANLEVDEHFVELFYSHESDRWVYNDIPDDPIKYVPNYKGKIGYICEYEK